jgi:hypothetical protein
LNLPVANDRKIVMEASYSDRGFTTVASSEQHKGWESPRRLPPL